MRLRVLIFEDEASSRHILQVACERRGYEVFTFPDPRPCPLHVMDRCRCPAGVTCTDIILADLNMPQIHGLEFFEALFGLVRDGKLNDRGTANPPLMASFIPAYWNEIRVTKPPEIVHSLLFGILRSVTKLLGY